MPHAVTPYNFVPLPERIVPAPLHDLPPDDKRPDKAPHPPLDRYHEVLHTGWFDVEIEALTPVYTRAPRGVEPDFPAPVAECGEGEQKQPADFFHMGDPTKKPVLPGSSLRGMIRTVFEIMTSSEMTFFNDSQFFFRAFAEIRGTGLRALYQNRFDTTALRGGVLIHDGKGLKLRVSNRSLNGFVVVRANGVRADITHRNRGQFKAPFRVSVRILGDRHLQVPVHKAEITDYKGRDWLIIPGVDVPKKKGAQRSWYQVILHPDEDDYAEYDVPEDIYRHYLEWRRLAHGQRSQALPRTDGKGNQFTPAPRLLKAGQPAFALIDKRSGKVVALGANMMMHLRYQTSVASVKERSLRGQKPPEWDMARAVFGYVPTSGKGQCVRSRVFFEDAPCTSQGNVFVRDEPFDVLLLGPKPTSFQVYLQQPNPEQGLQHWDSPEARLAGYKLYWHRSPEAALRALQTDTTPAEGASDLRSCIRPVKAGTRFRCRIRFENLTDAELGALYAAVQLPEGLAHKIGMAKSLGLGSVRLSVVGVRLFDMAQRYNSLDKHAGALAAEAVKPKLDTAYAAFVQSVMPGAKSLWASPRLQALACLLAWNGRPDDKETEQVGFSDQWKYRYTLRRPVELANLRLVSDVLRLPTAGGPQTIQSIPSQPASSSAQPRSQQSSPPSKHGQSPSPPKAGPQPSKKPAYQLGQKVSGVVVELKGLSEAKVRLPDGSIATTRQAYALQKGQSYRFKVVRLNKDGTVNEVAPA